MARLLTLKAADAMDRHGNKQAKDLIAAIKVIAPTMAQTVADRAIQVHGGMSVSDDTPVAGIFMLNRYVRITDGPKKCTCRSWASRKLPNTPRWSLGRGSLGFGDWAGLKARQEAVASGCFGRFKDRCCKPRPHPAQFVVQGHPTCAVPFRL